MAEPATEHRKLTDRYLQSLKGTKDGTPYDVRDTEVRGLRVRVMGSGERTFVLLARYSRDANPTRRALGSYPIMSLAQAREKAICWKNRIKAGADPSFEEERQRHAEERKRENSFASVAEKFIHHIEKQKLRTAPVTARNLRHTFVEEWKWGPRPITEITADDVKRVLRSAVDRGSPYQAFHDFALIRRLLNWAIGTDDYGLQFNPCDRLSSADIIGQRHARDRVLTNDELRALWRATARFNYPYGPLYRLLLLTGLRLGEVCGAHRSEFAGREWTISASRMKKTKSAAKPFIVPLTDDIATLIDALPQFNSGEFLFSNDFGKNPVRPANFSDPKDALDALMLEELRKMAIDCGKQPDRVTLPPFVNHDIRRTVRTHLSALKISEEVREAVLAHVRPGIKGVYDWHQYLEEKREALILWNARLRSIVEPAPANVITLRAAQ
jgi:integrase